LLDDELAGSSLPSATFGELGSASSSPDDETRKLEVSTSFATAGEGILIGASPPSDDLLFWLRVMYEETTGSELAVGNVAIVIGGDDGVEVRLSVLREAGIELGCLNSKTFCDVNEQ